MKFIVLEEETKKCALNVDYIVEMIEDYETKILDVWTSSGSKYKFENITISEFLERLKVKQL